METCVDVVGRRGEVRRIPLAPPGKTISGILAEAHALLLREWPPRDEGVVVCHTITIAIGVGEGEVAEEIWATNLISPV